MRRATIQDAASVAELMTGLNQVVGVSGFPPPDDLAPENVLLTAEAAARRMQMSADVESVWLAEEDGSHLGLMSLRIVPYLDQDAPYAEVMNLFVRPQARRRGVARLLIEAAEREAAARGATVVRILTGADNLPAQAFYRAAGYAMPNVSFEKFLTAEGAARD